MRILWWELLIWLKSRLELQNICNLSYFWKISISNQNNESNEKEWYECDIFICKIFFLLKCKHYFHFWCWNNAEINIFYFLKTGNTFFVLLFSFINLNLTFTLNFWNIFLVYMNLGFFINGVLFLNQIFLRFQWCIKNRFI